MNRKNKITSDEFGIITSCIAALFKSLQYLPLQSIIGSRLEAFGSTPFEEHTIEEQKRRSKIRSRLIDLYIIEWIVIVEIPAIILIAIDVHRHEVIKWTLLILVPLRLLDILQVNVNSTLFDPLRTGIKSNYIASVVRSLINIIVNYFEIMICFGILYSFGTDYISNVNDWTDPFYYSIVTQITLGFEEMLPTGVMKILTVMQLGIGFFFTILILGRFVSFLPQVRSVSKDGGNTP